MKKIFLLPLLAISLVACNKAPTYLKFEIKDFYAELDTRNFTASDGETTQIFYHENAIMYKATGQVDYGVVKMKDQGIFEIHETSVGEYESHGMITPNTDLDILDGCNNIHDIVAISANKWKLNGDNSYTIKPSANVYNVLIYTGYFLSDDRTKIKEILLKKTKAEEYRIDVVYTESKSLNYSITINNFGKNSNQKLDEFINNTTIQAQTEWNEYQLSAFEAFGLQDVPFLEAYTIGLKLYFQRVSSYASGGYICILYDCMSNVSKEADIANELVELGYTLKGDKYYAKETETLGVFFGVQYAFISYEEIEEMVERGETSPGNLLAYPTGYMQIVFAYSFEERGSSFEELNNVLSSSMHLPAFNEASYVKKITALDYKDSFNTAILEDEEYLEIFASLGLEPGPIYDEYISFFFYIDGASDATTFLDNYRASLYGSGYLFNQVNDYDVESKSIAEMSTKCVEYYKNASGTNKPQYVLDMYLYDSSQSGDFDYNGVVEIVLTKYTDLGVQVIYGGE